MPNIMFSREFQARGRVVQVFIIENTLCRKRYTLQRIFIIAISIWFMFFFESRKRQAKLKLLK